MGRRLQKYDNWIAGLLALANLAFATAALHDMQTAEGVGLYFALKQGTDRLPFDLSVDMTALLGLLCLTLLPCVLLRHGNVVGFCRLLIGFLAFMPALSMAYLLNPLGAEEIFSPELFLSVLQIPIPFLGLLAAALALGDDAAGESGGLDGSAWKRWYSLCCLAAVLLAAGAFCQPSLQPLFVFVLTYLLLIVSFDLWERLFMRYPALNLWGWALFGGLELRAVYVLAEIMRKY